MKKDLLHPCVLHKCDYCFRTSDEYDLYEHNGKWYCDTHYEKEVL